jgi:hypothetical protein
MFRFWKGRVVKNLKESIKIMSDKSSKPGLNMSLWKTFRDYSLYKHGILLWRAELDKA